MDQPKGELQEKIRPVAQHREMRDFREMRDSGRCAIPGGGLGSGDDRANRAFGFCLPADQRFKSIQTDSWNRFTFFQMLPVYPINFPLVRPETALSLTQV